MKIYTKKGDKGMTSLIGGLRVAKHHKRIDAYGTIDELNSNIGMVRSYCKDPLNVPILATVQDILFTIGSHLASSKDSKMVLPALSAVDVETLEQAIDKMNEELPELKTFILPAGNVEIAAAHIARCVCRRAERLIVALNEEEPVEELILTYINRLSDYLFVLARFIGHQTGTEEIPWKPGKD